MRWFAFGFAVGVAIVMAAKSGELDPFWECPAFLPESWSDRIGR